jgi:hypothetical protein
LGRVVGGRFQLRLKVLGLNAESFLKILGAQKLINEGVICSHMPFYVRLERADLIFLCIRKTPLLRRVWTSGRKNCPRADANA